MSLPHLQNKENVHENTPAKAFSSPAKGSPAKQPTPSKAKSSPGKGFGSPKNHFGSPSKNKQPLQQQQQASSPIKEQESPGKQKASSPSKTLLSPLSGRASRTIAATNSPLKVKMFGHGSGSMKSTQSEEKSTKTSILSDSLFQELQLTVFGMPLDRIMVLQSGCVDLHHLIIPQFIIKSIKFLLPAYTNEEGLFRKSGEQTEIEEHKKAMDPCRPMQEQFFPLGTDPHTVTGLIKAFFRELPAPLIKLEVHSLLVDNFAAPEGERSMKIRQTLKIHLTGLEYEVLAALMYLLHEVQLCEEHNLMPASNLALVISPNLVSGGHIDLAAQIRRNNLVVEYVTHIILNFREIFPGFEPIVPAQIGEVIPTAECPFMAPDFDAPDAKSYADPDVVLRVEDIFGPGGLSARGQARQEAAQREREALNQKEQQRERPLSESTTKASSTTQHTAQSNTNNNSNAATQATSQPDASKTSNIEIIRSLSLVIQDANSAIESIGSPRRESNSRCEHSCVSPRPAVPHLNLNYINQMQQQRQAAYQCPVDVESNAMAVETNSVNAANSIANDQAFPITTELKRSSPSHKDNNNSSKQATAARGKKSLPAIPTSPQASKAEKEKRVSPSKVTSPSKFDWIPKIASPLSNRKEKERDSEREKQQPLSPKKSIASPKKVKSPVKESAVRSPTKEHQSTVKSPTKEPVSPAIGRSHKQQCDNGVARDAKSGERSDPVTDLFLSGMGIEKPVQREREPRRQQHEAGSQSEHMVSESEPAQRLVTLQEFHERLEAQEKGLRLVKLADFHQSLEEKESESSTKDGFATSSCKRDYNSSFEGALETPNKRPKKMMLEDFHKEHDERLSIHESFATSSMIDTDTPGTADEAVTMQSEIELPAEHQQQQQRTTDSCSTNSTASNNSGSSNASAQSSIPSVSSASTILFATPRKHRPQNGSEVPESASKSKKNIGTPVSAVKKGFDSIGKLSLSSKKKKDLGDSNTVQQSPFRTPSVKGKSNLKSKPLDL